MLSNVPYDSTGKRRADFPLRGKGCISNERSKVVWFSLPLAALPPKAAYMLIARRAMPSLLNLLNLLNPGRFAPLHKI